MGQITDADCPARFIAASIRMGAKHDNDVFRLLTFAATDEAWFRKFAVASPDWRLHGR